MKDIPGDLERFLAATPFAGAHVTPIEGDASFRRYFRLAKGDERAILMHAPPPHEDPSPFIAAARWLRDNGLRAPTIIAADEGAGWVLIEDFGSNRMKEWIDAHPADEETIYAEAVDVLVRLHARPPGPFPPYDMAVYRREADLFVEWYCPAAGLEVDRESWDAAWTKVLASLVATEG